jgi:hypothetical protein
MRTPFLVHVSAPEPRKSQADGRHGLTVMNLDEPDDVDDDDDDDDFGDDDEKRDDDDEDEDDEEDEDDDEPETWQVGVRGMRATPPGRPTSSQV